MRKQRLECERQRRDSNLALLIPSSGFFALHHTADLPGLISCKIFLEMNLYLFAVRNSRRLPAELFHLFCAFCTLCGLHGRPQNRIIKSIGFPVIYSLCNLRQVNISEPQFPHLENGSNDSTFFPGMLWGLWETVQVKHSAQCLA